MSTLEGPDRYYCALILCTAEKGYGGEVKLLSGLKK